MLDGKDKPIDELIFGKKRVADQYLSLAELISILFTESKKGKKSYESIIQSCNQGIYQEDFENG